MMVSCYGGVPEEAISGSPHAFLTWIRSGLMAAKHAHGPGVCLCSNSICEVCLVIWRQTPETRVCHICDNGVGFFVCDRPAVIYARAVRPDPGSSEPRLHHQEYETCSGACKRQMIAQMKLWQGLSSNDVIDSECVPTSAGQGLGHALERMALSADGHV